MVNFTIDQERLTGNEDDFSVTLAIASVTGDNRDTDTNPTNNAVLVNFEIEAQADIVVNSL